MERSKQIILLEQGVDWLTATARPGRQATLLTTVAWQWQRDRADEGYQISPWRWNGYDGDTTDGLTLAKRDDGTIIRLSGDMARRHWQAVMSMVTNVSRIDLQATIHDPDVTRNYAMNASMAAGEAALVKSGMTGTKLTINRPAGTTFNIGSRASGRYFRLYDKASESGGEYPKGSWRYEVEYKGDRAYRLARRIADAPRPTDALYDVVVEAFKAYDVAVPITSVPSGWRETVTRHVTDDERRLSWLRRCIRPSVLKLSEAYSADTLAAALGLYGIIDDIHSYVSSWSDVDLPTEDT